MEDIGIISLCLVCEHFSGKPDYVAKRNDGIRVVASVKNNFCLKHDYALGLIDSPVGLVPDVAECRSYRKDLGG